MWRRYCNEETIVEGSELKKDKAAYQILEVDNRKDPPLILFAAPTYYNCELNGDKKGLVRYTCVHMTLKEAKKLEGDMDYVWDALKVINRLIEAYRYVAKESHIEKITIKDLYSINISTTFAFPPQWNVVPLSDDLSEGQHLEIRKMLENNETAPLDGLLLLDAKMFIGREDYRRAVIECIIAIEPLIEDFIKKELKKSNIPEKCKDHESFCTDNFFHDLGLSKQLILLLHLISSDTSSDKLNPEWIRNLMKINSLRNAIIHDWRTKKVKVEWKDAEQAINCTEKIIAYIKNRLEE